MKKYQKILFFSFLAILIILIIANDIYSPSNFVWHDDADALSKITPFIHKTMLVELTNIVLCSLLLIVIINSRLTTIRKYTFATLLAIFCFTTTKVVKKAMYKDYYYIWKYQRTNEDVANSLLPEITPSNLPLFLADLANNREDARTRSRIALAMGDKHVSESSEILSDIIRNNGEDIYLRYNALKSLRNIDDKKFNYYIKNLGNDSLLVIYRKYKNPEN